MDLCIPHVNSFPPFGRDKPFNLREHFIGVKREGNRLIDCFGMICESKSGRNLGKKCVAVIAMMNDGDV